MNIERRVSTSAVRGGKAKQRAHFVVDAGKVRSVCDIESFGGKYHVDPLTQFVLPGQTHVEINIVWTETAVARSSDRSLIGRVIVTVHFGSSEQIERMSAVVLEDWRKREA